LPEEICDAARSQWFVVALVSFMYSCDLCAGYRDALIEEQGLASMADSPPMLGVAVVVK
jgi:hypothetical protein